MLNKLPRPTPPPALVAHKFVIIPYIYVLALIFLAVWQLITFPQFTTYIADYLGGHVTNATIFAAILVVALEVFSVPFLLRLHLSPLARLCSAVAGLLVPVAWSAVTLALQPLTSVYVPADILFILWGAVSFWVMGGQQVLRVRL